MLNILKYKSIHNFKTIFLVIILFGLLNCSSSAKRSASPYFLDKVAEFEGKFSVYISDQKLVNNSIIESQDCESWQIQIELDEAYKESLKNIINRMFKNVEFTDRELTEDELASSEILAQIIFKNYMAKASNCSENTANYNITLQTDLNVKSHLRSISNSVVLISLGIRAIFTCQ